MPHVTVMSSTFTLLHRPSGEHDKLATTAFFLPDDVPEMLHITPHPSQFSIKILSKHTPSGKPKRTW